MDAMEVLRGGEVAFRVLGKPAPAGSKRGFVVGGRVVLTDASKATKPWQALVQAVAIECMGDRPPLEGPLRADLTFIERRPKSHFTAKGELTAEGRRKRFPVKAPDRLKLARAVEDALSGVVYRDDSQLVAGETRKEYGEWDGVLIHVQEV